MALSPKEQQKVTQLLGYGGKTIQAGSVIYNKILNDRLNQLPPDTEEFVREWIEQVYVIEQQMKCAPTRLSTSKVQDIELNAHELPMLRSERKRIARELAAALDVPYMGSGANIRLAL